MNNSDSFKKGELVGSNDITNPSNRRATSSISDPVMTIGRDEMNLADFPLALLTTRPPKGVDSLVFEDEIWDKRQRACVKKRLRIVPCTEYGLPTAADDEVILGLVQLTYAARFASRKLSFKPADLFRILGWRGEGRDYSRLEESLKRWVGVTLYYEHAWWDKNLKTWMDEHFHLLDNVVLPRRRSRQGKKRQPGRRSPWLIIWNETVFKSFQDGYLRKLDIGVLRRLKSTAAKRMYRFLGKRFHFTNRVTFDLRVFACERVGFSRKDDNAQLKRRVHRASRELEAVGFLSPSTKEQRFRQIRRGQWEVTFVRCAKQECETSVRRAIHPLEAALVDRGVHDPAAAALVRNHSAETIRKSLREFDKLRDRGGDSKLNNPAGLLITWIKSSPNGAGICSRSKANPVLPGAGRSEASESPKQLAVVREYLAKLSPAELESLRAMAMKGATLIQRKGYQRALAEGNLRLLEEYRNAIIETNVLRLLRHKG